MLRAARWICLAIVPIAILVPRSSALAQVDTRWWWCKVTVLKPATIYYSEPTLIEAGTLPETEGAMESGFVAAVARQYHIDRLRFNGGYSADRGGSCYWEKGEAYLRETMAQKLAEFRESSAHWNVVRTGLPVPTSGTPPVDPPSPAAPVSPSAGAIIVADVETEHDRATRRAGEESRARADAARASRQRRADALNAELQAHLASERARVAAAKARWAAEYRAYIAACAARGISEANCPRRGSAQ